MTERFSGINLDKEELIASIPSDHKDLLRYIELRHDRACSDNGHRPRVVLVVGDSAFEPITVYSPRAKDGNARMMESLCALYVKRANVWLRDFKIKKGVFHPLPDNEKERGRKLVEDLAMDMSEDIINKYEGVKTV